MSIFTTIGSAFKKLWRIIVSPKAQKAVSISASLVEIALPIVQELSIIDPKTSKLQEVIDAYEKYGVPLIDMYIQNPTSIGNALLNLATELLRRKLSPEQANLATNILNTAVQIAVTAIKAK